MNLIEKFIKEAENEKKNLKNAMLEHLAKMLYVKYSTKESLSDDEIAERAKDVDRAKILGIVKKYKEDVRKEKQLNHTIEPRKIMSAIVIEFVMEERGSEFYGI